MTSLDTLKTKREQANKYVSEIESMLTSASEIHESIQVLSKRINESKNSLKSKTTALNRLEGSATSSINGFRKKREEISKLLQQANNFYTEKFLPLSQQINNSETGLKVTLRKSQRDKNEIHKIAATCNQKYEEIKKSSLELRKQITQLRKISNIINSLHNSSQKNKATIDNLVSKIRKIETETGQILRKLNTEHEKAKGINKEITSLKSESSITHDQINKIRIESQSKLDSIEDIYQLAHETGLSGEFEKRRNQHKVEKDKWRKWVFGMSIGLLGSLITLYVCQLWLNDWKLSSTVDVNFYIRFVILSPVVYYLYFSSVQYSKERKLFDKYSFKATLASQINAHIELLTNHEKFENEEELNKILDFIIEAFEKIYSEPFDEEYRLKFKLADIELNLEKKLLDKLGLKAVKEK